jgi:hypothetical protein
LAIELLPELEVPFRRIILEFYPSIFNASFLFVATAIQPHLMLEFPHCPFTMIFEKS